MIVPKNSTESATAAGDRGFVHPQFNGKIPSNGNNFKSQRGSTNNELPKDAEGAYCEFDCVIL